ncbi:serine/threonine-protein kinase pim-1-like [Cyprinodon tularosa]|uniref:serine/threonine-protein kinase pim-1-like n=1 Tax=Cyprinodon tularosa TaxID=77115 RepID=UPI0018E20498|nr:serine/threonine-protein kinase pim-1-like [Cyprinodon tularosa]
MTEEEQTEPPAKKIKTEIQLEQVPTTPSPSLDINKESSSPNPLLPSTKNDSRERNLKRKAEDLIEQPSKKVKFTETDNGAISQESKFLEKYAELHKLGEGAFGSVFAGYRREDELPVAIKRILKNYVNYNHKDENSRNIPLEVAVMLKLRDTTVQQSTMVFLLDWYDLDEEVILVMERPMPCDNLSNYLTKQKAPLEEKDAKIIIKQLVQAAIYLHNTNIFHGDIKLDNILIRTGSEEPQVYLIDFGLSCFVERKPNQALGSFSDDLPMDWFSQVNHNAEPTTVWQLGEVLFQLVHNKVLDTNEFEISETLSENCQDFLTKALMIDAEDWPPLEDLLGHPWLL